MKIGGCSRSPDSADFTVGPAPDQTIDPTGDEGDDARENRRKEADGSKGCHSILLTRRELVSVI